MHLPGIRRPRWLWHRLLLRESQKIQKLIPFSATCADLDRRGSLGLLPVLDVREQTRIQGTPHLSSSFRFRREERAA